MSSRAVPTFAGASLVARSASHATYPVDQTEIEPLASNRRGRRIQSRVVAPCLPVQKPGQWDATHHEAAPQNLLRRPPLLGHTSLAKAASGYEPSGYRPEGLV